MKYKSWAVLLAAVGMMLGSVITAGAIEYGADWSDVWSMAEFGDYLYIGTGGDSSSRVFRGYLEANLRQCKSQGFLEESADPAGIAEALTETIFGETGAAEGNSAILAVHRESGEAEVIFRGSGSCRSAVEFNGKLYFAGDTLVEVDPVTRSVCEIRDASCLAVWGDELVMGTPGGIILAGSDPGSGQWRVIGDQGDFDDLPAVMQADGLNGGGIWDIIEFNGSLYASIVTDRDIGGQIHKQGFALYRGDPGGDGSFTWTQVVGDQGTSGYPFGMGVRYSTACDLWVYDGYLYLGTCSDPMPDLAAGNFEQLYNDLDHSVYLYRMDESERFQMVEDGLGQCVRSVGVRNGKLYLGTWDIGELHYPFARIMDGRVAVLDQEDIQARADALGQTLTELLEIEDAYLAWLMEEVRLAETMTGLYQAVACLATDPSEGKNPVPEYRACLAEFEAFRAQVFALLEDQLASADFPAVYQEKTGETGPEELRKAVRETCSRLFLMLDDILYDETLHDFIYCLGCGFHTRQGETGFRLLSSEDGVNFDTIPRTGDGARLMLWLAILPLSAGAVLVWWKQRQVVVRRATNNACHCEERSDVAIRSPLYRGIPFGPKNKQTCPEKRTS